MILDTLRSSTNRHEVLVRYIEDQMLELLNWSERRRPELSRGFAAIGFDSLKSIDLQLRMQEELKYISRSGAEFREPTIAPLAAHLLDKDLLPLDQSTSPPEDNSQAHT